MSRIAMSAADPLLATAPAASCENDDRVKPAGWLSLLKRYLLATAAAGLIATSLPGGTAAENLKSISLHYYDNDEDEDYQEIFRDLDDPGWYVVKIVYKNGYVLTVHMESNPGPDDTTSRPKGDRDSRIALAKQSGGGKFIADQYFWDSELGKSLTAKGKGPAPVINPGDDDDPGGGPRNPSRGKEKLGEPEIINHTEQLGSGKGGGFQFDGGSPGEQLKKGGGPKGPPGKNNGNGDDDDDDDKGSNGPPPGTYFGPAELIDPLGPPIPKQAARSKTEKSGKARAQVTSKLGKPSAGPLTGKLITGQADHGQADHGQAEHGQADNGPGPAGTICGTRADEDDVRADESAAFTRIAWWWRGTWLTGPGGSGSRDRNERCNTGALGHRSGAHLGAHLGGRLGWRPLRNRASGTDPRTKRIKPAGHGFCCRSTYPAA